MRDRPGAARLRRARTARRSLWRSFGCRRPIRLTGSARCSSTRAGRAARASTSRSSRARPSSRRRGACEVRPRRLRPARDHPQHRRFAASAPTGSGDRSSCRSRSRATPLKSSSWMDADLYVDSACAQRGGRIADHMSTAECRAGSGRASPGSRRREAELRRRLIRDVPRTDVREHVPDRIRAMIIDGVLDPIAWTTGAATARRCRSRRGSAATRARRQRSTSSSASATPAAGRCVRAGPHTAQRFTALARGAQGPVRSGRVPGRLDGSEAQLLDPDRHRRSAPMYDSSSWEDFAGALADVEAQARPRQRLGVALAAASGTPATRLHHEARLPALLQLRELPRRGLRGLGQPAHICGLVDCGRRRGRAVRQLRADLDMGVVDLRRVAERRMPTATPGR